jgi:DNA-binding Xre family transcriptional regulator
MTARKTRIMYRLLVRQIAEHKGISRTRLSRLAELQYDTINGIWQNDRRDVSLSTLIKIARALHTNLSELYELVNDQEESPSPGH